MLRVSPFYDHYTIRIRASCHKKNMLRVSKMHVRRSGVYLYRVPTVGRPTLGFWVVPGPIPLFLLRTSDLYSPPAACLAGDLPSPDGMTLGGDAGLTGGQEPLAQQRHRCPGAPPCLPSQSVQGSGMQPPPSQPDLS